MIMRNDYEADRPLQERSRLMLFQFTIRIRCSEWWRQQPGVTV